MQDYQLDWVNVIGLCTDGAAAMTGVKNGLSQGISEVANANFMSSHCIIHREALASKKMSPQLNETLLTLVKMINNIKANALNSRVFSLIRKEMGSDHKTLLLHTEVRWLSRGRVLSRLFELRHDSLLRTIYRKQAKEKKKKNETSKEKLIEEIFLEKINDHEWLSMLAYLPDIFGFMNEINLQLQGRCMNCFIFWNKIDAFQKKISTWKQQVMQSNFTTFSLTNAALSEYTDIPKFIQPIILDHLEQLIDKFKEYFPECTDPRTYYLWIVNPFLNVNEPNSLTSFEQNQLLGKFLTFQFNCIHSSLIYFYCIFFSFSMFIELTSDRTLQNYLGKIELKAFWLGLQNEYVALSKIAINCCSSRQPTYAKWHSQV